MSEQAAWLAGLVDGEGCFTVAIWAQHKHTLKFGLMFSISMKAGRWAIEASHLLQHYAIPFHMRNRRNQVEMVVNSHKSVKKLINILVPYLVVKRPLAERLLGFPEAPPRNRFREIDSSYLDSVCEIVDFVREFNRGKNRRHKWNSTTIRLFYEVARGGLSGD